MKDRPMRSLVVEDNPGDVGLLRVMLGGERNLRVVAYVSTMREAEIFLSANAVDVVLLDLGLPDAQGLEALRRARAAAPGTPLVILSGHDDERLALEAVHEGAQDYLIKGQIESGALLRALRYAIERRSLEAAAEELSDKVQVARDEAEAATVVKANFVSNMSHEIRTPLHSIIGFSELLLDDSSLNHRQRRYLELVKNAGGALLTVVNDILDFSKLDAGKMTLAHEDFSLETLIRSTVSIIEGSAESKGLGLDLFIDPELTLHNRGDSSRLRQIILNLLSNAVKFTISGKISLDIRKISYCATRENLRFTVCDTGPGVKAEWQPLLFQQFSQADASASREHGGTGLGLSICKSLVELMGGRIGYQENEAGGSAFWFEIELERAPKLEMKLEDSRLTSRLAGLKVLLVEDVPMNQELACAILRRGGHAVEIAGDGTEAVAAARERPFDVILMDIQMPNMDGVTATRKIRELSGPARRIPIIALTANAMPEQVLEYYSAGMDAHIAKPFTQLELHDVIQRTVYPLARWRSVDGSIKRCGRTETGDEDRDFPTPSSGGTLRRGTKQAVEIRSHSRDTCFGEGRAAVVAETIFDPQVLAKVQLLISPKRVVDYMRDLDEELSRLAVSSIDEPTLQSQAHRVISQAGMLGLMRISNCARSLSNACRSKEGQAEALLHFQEAAGDLKLYAAPAAGIAFNFERGAHD